MSPTRAVLAAGLIVATFSVSVAKLPPPPPMDDKAKAAAEEKKAKDAASAEATKQQQARAEDRVAARYIAEQKAKGIVVQPTPVVPPQPPAPAAAPAAAATPAGTGQSSGAAAPMTPQGNTPSGPATSAPQKDPAKK